MDINLILKEKNISRYRLAKLSGVPNATLNDICSGKACIEKCSAETIYKIAKALHVTMEELIQDYVKGEDGMNTSASFEVFKSNVCHRVKDIGEIPYIVETLQSDEIRQLFNKKKYAHALYLLAMVDYLSRENQLPICAEYSDIRRNRLNKPIYPQSILAMSLVTGNEEIKKRSWDEAIPEFKRFNIVENEVQSVV